MHITRPRHFSLSLRLLYALLLGACAGASGNDDAPDAGQTRCDASLAQAEDAR
jgi:hypothetical protein